jgi:16S rRNA processing protein RimM
LADARGKPQAAVMMSDGSPYLALGRVTRPHGVRGEVRIVLYNPSSTALEGLTRVLLRGEPGATPVGYEVQQVRLVPEGALVVLAGVEDRDAAEALRGLEVIVDRAELPPLGEDEIYLADLEGCEVLTSTGRSLGRVHEVLDVGPHATLVIRDPEVERLLPYVPDFIVGVDLEQRRLWVDPPEDLPEERLRRG